jgi:hypothetical protein
MALVICMRLGMAVGLDCTDAGSMAALSIPGVLGRVAPGSGWGAARFDEAAGCGGRHRSLKFQECKESTDLITKLL